jgi:hypothetical protein
MLKILQFCNGAYNVNSEVEFDFAELPNVASEKLANDPSPQIPVTKAWSGNCAPEYGYVFQDAPLPLDGYPWDLES